MTTDLDEAERCMALVYETSETDQNRRTQIEKAVDALVRHLRSSPPEPGPEQPSGRFDETTLAGRAQTLVDWMWEGPEGNYRDQCVAVARKLEQYEAAAAKPPQPVGAVATDSPTDDELMDIVREQARRDLGNAAPCLPPYPCTPSERRALYEAGRESARAEREEIALLRDVAAAVATLRGKHGRDYIERELDLAESRLEDWKFQRASLRTVPK